MCRRLRGLERKLLGLVDRGCVVTSSELPAARILAIQDFWQRFFAASGAELPLDRYGAALVRFP